MGKGSSAVMDIGYTFVFTGKGKISLYLTKHHTMMMYPALN